MEYTITALIVCDIEHSYYMKLFKKSYYLSLKSYEKGDFQ